MAFLDLTATLVSAEVERATSNLPANDSAALRAITTARVANSLSLFLYSEFDVFRRSRTSGLDLWLAMQSGAITTTLYDDFCASIIDRATQDQHLEALSSITSRVVQQTLSFLAELRQRFQHGSTLLSSTLLDGRPLGELETINAGFSDSHADGRLVAHCTTTEGHHLYYKPRSAWGEIVLGSLVDIFNSYLPPALSVSTLSVLDVGDHSWSPCIERQPSAEVSPDDLALRIGIFATLLWAIALRDAHVENVLIANNSCLIVDAECVLHPDLPEETLPPFLQSGLLPTGGVIDPSPMVATNQTVEALAGWRRMDTDSMEPVGFLHPDSGETAMPLLPAAAHAKSRPKSLANGVKIGHDALQLARRDLTEFVEQVDGAAWSRVVLRPSIAYERLVRLGAMATVRHSQTRAREILLQILTQMSPWLTPIAPEETAALVNLDIPRVEGSVSTGELRLHTTEMTAPGLISGGIVSLRRLSELSEFTWHDHLELLVASGSIPRTMWTR